MEKENIEIWTTSNWTFQARQIIESITKFPEDSNLIILEATILSKNKHVAINPFSTN